MALTITATVDPTSHAVTLDVAGGTPDYTVQAAPAGDLDTYTVRARWTRPPGADATRRMTVDGDVPLNTATVYVVTDKAGAQAQTPQVVVAASSPVLSDATDPSLSLDVVVVSQPPNEWEARSVWWDVLGASAPFASVAPMRTRSGDLVLYADTLAHRRALRALLAPGRPVILRAVCPDAVDDLTILPAAARDELVSADNPSGPRLFTITYQALNREQLGPFAVDPARTYAQVVAEDATYRDVLARFVTYAELLAGQPGASLDAETWTDGGFTGGQGLWDTFWSSSVTWSFDGSDASAEAGASGAIAVLAQWQNRAPAASRRLRVSGRVRMVAPGASAMVQLVSAKAPANAVYLDPGASYAAAPVKAGATWSTFTVDLDVPGPAADDRTTCYLRCEAMPVGGIVEWDDVSARWHL